MSDLDLLLTLTHTFVADIDMTLMSPSGTVATITTDNGAGNDNVFNGTRFDVYADPDGAVPYTTNPGVVSDHPYVNLTTATPLTPEESFGAFIGENPNGTWTLTISDDLVGDGGLLDSWTLEPTTVLCVPPPPLAPSNPAGASSAGQVAGKVKKKCKKKKKGRKGALVARKRCKRKK